jgi:hypothetical protein
MWSSAFDLDAREEHCFPGATARSLRGAANRSCLFSGGSPLTSITKQLASKLPRRVRVFVGRPEHWTMPWGQVVGGPVNGVPVAAWYGSLSRIHCGSPSIPIRPRSGYSASVLLVASPAPVRRPVGATRREAQGLALRRRRIPRRATTATAPVKFAADAHAASLR